MTSRIHQHAVRPSRSVLGGGLAETTCGASVIALEPDKPVSMPPTGTANQ